MARQPVSEEQAERGRQLGALLRASRQAAGMSQQLLAERARVSIAALAKLESGRTPEPGFFFIAQVVSALRVALPGTARTSMLDEVYATFTAE